MLNWLTRLKEFFMANAEEPETYTDIINRERHLPCCGSRECHPGPEAGINRNVICANPNCRQEWNLAFFNGVCVYAEKI